MLSPQQAKTILTTVVREHLQKLGRVAALELADGIDAVDGRRANLVMGWVLRLRAARGPKARIEAEDLAGMKRDGLVDEDVVDVAKTIVTLREKRFHTDMPSAKVIKLLESVQAPLSLGDIAQAEQLMQRGQAAALMAVAKRWSAHMDDDDDLIGEIFSAPADTRRSDVAADGQPLMTYPPTARVEPAPAVATEPAPLTTITSLSERLIGEKAAASEWQDKTQRQVRSVAALFVKMLGVDNVMLVIERHSRITSLLS